MTGVEDVGSLVKHWTYNWMLLAATSIATVVSTLKDTRQHISRWQET